MAAVAPLLPRLLLMLGPLGEQRGMATLAEWKLAQALCAGGAR